MENSSATETVGGLSHTTRRREWLGWFGSITWLFSMMYGYEAIIYGYMTINLESEVDPSWYPVAFMLLFAISIVAFGWRYGRDPKGLSRIAFYTTPIAIAATVVFPLLPSPIGSILYAISPLFMAPAITRRVYGVIQTAGSKRRLTRYMSGIVACVAVFTVWLMLDLPPQIAFIIPALLSVLAWIGVRRNLKIHDDGPHEAKAKLSVRTLLLLIAVLVTLVVLDFLNAAIHTTSYLIADELTEIILSVMVLLLPPAGFMLYAIISDKGHEQIGFICGMALLLIGIQLAFIAGDAQRIVVILMSIAGGIGGAYTEFFVLTIPLFFLAGAKRPIFVASLGVVINLLTSAFGQQAYLVVPEAFLTLDTPLLVSASVLTLVFIVLVYILFVNQREKTFAATLRALLHGSGDKARADGGDSDADGSAPSVQDTQVMKDAGFTVSEIKVAILLLEGNTRSDILRKLHISAAEASQHERAIRKKIMALGESDPSISTIVAEYTLTKRETDMLRFLRRGMTNAAIAQELFLSEETIKIHVRNLMRKIPVSNRAEVAAWVGSFATTSGV